MSRPHPKPPWWRAASHRGAAAPTGARRLGLEPLESRLLLSADGFDAYTRVDPAWFAEASGGPSVAATNAADADDRFILRLSREATAEAGGVAGAAGLLADLPIQVIRGLGKPGQLLVTTAGGEGAAALAADPRIDEAVADSIVEGQRAPNDPRFVDQTNLQTVDAEQAWDLTIGSPTVVVGSIDSGVDLAHPDLYLNIWINQGEVPQQFLAPQFDTDGDGLLTFYDLNDPANAGLVAERPDDGNAYIDALDILADPAWANGIDTDQNGFTDDFFGWNFRSGADEPFAPNNPSDDVGHGTHVAGVLGATADDTPGGGGSPGVAGLNWRTSIMALRFLDRNLQGAVSDAIMAVNYATMMRTQFGVNVRATNNSWGQTGGFNAELRDAIQASGEAGILFVAAAGNGNILGEGINNDANAFFPASYDLPNVVSVAAVGEDDELAFFSNFGPTSVDVAAPGVGVLSTIPGTFATANGTSMAAPHVTGAAALVWSRVPNATVAEVRDAILAGVDSVAGLQGRVATGGRINVRSVLDFPGFAPNATLVAAADITTAGAFNQTVTIDYFDINGIDAATIGADDVVLEQQWGERARLTPIAVSAPAPRPDGSLRVTYTFAPPGGGWDPFDFGEYQVQVQEGAVANAGGLTAAAGSIGSFRVQVEAGGVFYVNSTSDRLDANPGDGDALDAFGFTTLRAAVQEANLAGTPTTIILDAGTHSFSPPGTPNLPGSDTLATAQDLEGEAWRLSGDANIFNSATVPHVTITGSGDGTFDYFSFEVGPGGGLATFDIDNTTFDTELFLFDENGALVASNDDNLTTPDFGSNTGLDSLILDEPLAAGRYVVGVGRFNSFATPTGIAGDAPQPGDLYTLHVSVENHPLAGEDATGDLDVFGDITIVGDTPATTIVNANQLDRVFDVEFGGRLRVERVTVTGGLVDVSASGGLMNDGGGGFRSRGELTIAGSVVTNNTAEGSVTANNQEGDVGGVIAFGGGVFAPEGLLTTFDSTFSDNQATNGGGVSIGDGLDGGAFAVVSSSTFTGNIAAIGGGLFVGADGSGQATNTTISGNQSPQGAGVSGPFEGGGQIDLFHVTVTENFSGFGAGVVQRVSGAIGNSIVAGNFTSADGIGPGLVSSGFNLFGQADSAVLQSSDALVTAENLRLGPLQDNGGPTATHLPLPGSPAIDVVDGPLFVGADQRGVIRPVDGDGDGDLRADAGAVERARGSISGVLFDDRNRDGVQGPNEPGLGGRTVFLDTNGNGVLDPFEPRTVTEEEDPATLSVLEGGRYRFDDLEEANTYLVTQVVDPGWEATGAGRVGTSVVSLQSNGNPLPGFNGRPSINDTGRVIAFETGDFGNFGVAIFNRDTEVLETIDSSGTRPSLSGDGSLLAYERPGSVRVLDRNTSLLTSFAGDRPSVSADGRFIAYRLGGQIVLRDVLLSESVPLVDAGQPGAPTISRDGRFVSFASATDIVAAGDSNGVPDLFLYDVVTSQLEVLGSGLAEVNVLGEPTVTDISDDGRFVVFGLTFDGVAPGDINGFSDVYLFDRTTDQVELISSSPTGAPANGGSIQPVISGDGTHVVYITDATNLTQDGFSPQTTVAVHDLRDGTTRPANVDADGAVVGGVNVFPAVNLDGSHVAFASNIIGGGGAMQDNIVVRDRPGSIRDVERVDLFPGRLVEGIDFGTAALPGSITGAHFDDLIANGRFDPGEPVLAGLTVFLDQDGDGVLDFNEPSTVTDAKGVYRFSGLEANTGYRVATVVPEGRELVLPTADDLGVYEVFLPPGGELTARDFGTRPASTGGQSQNAAVAGRVFRDDNRDGEQDPGEPGLPGVRVFVDRDDDGQRDFDEPLATTNALGDYAIAGLGSTRGAVRIEGPAADAQINPRGNEFSDGVSFTISPPTQPGDPHEVVTADFNGDGRDDVAVALNRSNEVAVLINNGAGGFLPPVRVGLGGGLGPSSLVAAQLNGAGSPDLAIANQLNNRVTVLLDWNGGGFASTNAIDLAQNAPGVGPVPSSIFAARIDGDQHVDLVTANSGSDSVSILSNNGAGGFSVASTVPTGGSDPFAVVVGDFDGANGPDLAVANAGSNLGGDPLGSVSVLLSNGAGGFDNPEVFDNANSGLGARPVSLVAGDFVGDGRLDLAVAAFSSNTVSVFEGGPGGEFTVRDPQPVGVGPIDLSSGDLDLDGDLDLVVTSLANGQSAVSTLRNLRSLGGDGFAPSETLGAAAFPAGLPVFFHALGQLDGDAAPDLVVGDGRTNSVLLQTNTIVSGGYQVALTGTEAFSDFDFAIEAPTAPGDYDGSGAVDLGDYQRWSEEFGRSGFGVTADGNRSGVVSAADFVVWRDSVPSTAAAVAGPDGTGAGVTGGGAALGPFVFRSDEPRLRSPSAGQAPVAGRRDRLDLLLNGTTASAHGEAPAEIDFNAVAESMIDDPDADAPYSDEANAVDHALADWLDLFDEANGLG